MKIIISLLLIFSTTKLDAQKVGIDTINESIILPKGIYYSFEEIKNRQPRDVQDVKIVKRTRKDISFNGGGIYGIELKDGTKRELKDIGKECMAVSDGKIFVFSSKYTMEGWRGYSRSYLSGPLLYVPFYTSLGQYTGGIIPSLISLSFGRVFDIDVGKYYNLDKKLLKLMIQKHHIKGFEDKKLMENAVNIIKKVNEKRNR